ncbi:MAG TPA: ABC transporter family substrate-binding protein [Acidimicrobiales bacterium]|nr:ABC transporter family substrate-binding protein [Acidimicrobiales bacterium]
MTGRSGPSRAMGLRFPWAVTATVVICVVAAACGSVSGSGAGAAASKTAATSHRAPLLVPSKGGTVTVALDQVPTTLNDHTAVGDTPAGRMLGSAIWAQVFRVGPDLTPQLDTNVVDSAEVISLAPQTVVYQINPRAVWSDGTPISVDDFTYAWQSQKGGAVDVDGTPDSVASTLGYRDIASLTGSNNGRTVTVVFRTPFADWPSLFDDLLPAHVAEQVGWNHGFDHFVAGVFVSGGPYEVQSYQPGSEVVLQRNPRWWGSPSSLDRISVRSMGAKGAMTSALGQGQVQVAYPSRFDQSFLAQASSSPVLQSQASLGTRMLQLEFNVRHAPLNVVSVREGIAHAVDRAGIVQSIGQPEDHSVWEDNHHLIPNGEPGYADDSTGYATADLVASAHLLQQSGFSLDGHGTWIAHGKPVSLDIVWAADDPWSAAAGPIVAAQLVAAGFDVVSTPMSTDELDTSALPTGAFDLALVPVDASAYPSALGNVFSTSPAITGGASSEDWSGFDDPKIDALFTQAVQELAPPQAHAIYQQIDQALWTAMPTLPLFAEPTLLVWSSSLSGVTDDPGGLGPLWSLRQWALQSAARTDGAKTQHSAIGPSRRSR